MGAGNVSLVYLRWSHLTDRPFRLLAYMALVSMDTDSPPVFFAGHSALARALGRTTPDRLPMNSTVAEKRAMRNDMEAVRIGLKPLMESRAVSILEAEAPGRSPRYALHLMLNDPGEPRTTTQANPGNDPGEPRTTTQGTPDDLGGVRGGDVDEKEERGEVRNTRGTKSPKVSSSPANPETRTTEDRSEFQRQSEALKAKYPGLREN